MVTTADLSELAAQDRSEIIVETGLAYDGLTPVRLHVSKRDRRYGVSDDGGAVAASGADSARVTFPDRIPIGNYEVNVNRQGIVCLCAVSPSATWLDTICDIVARGSIAMYENLLDATADE